MRMRGKESSVNAMMNALASSPLQLLLMLLFFGGCLSSEEVVSGPPSMGYCSMYGICDKAAKLSCARYIRAPVLEDPSVIASISELCEIDLALYGNRSCTTPLQWSYIKGGLLFAKPLLSPCPACWKNFRTLWCEMSVLPDQSAFVGITETKPVHNGETGSSSAAVTAIDYYITPKMRQGLFDSCANVSMGMSNKKVLEVMFSSEAVRDPIKLFDMMGMNSTMRSPYLIKFPVLSASSPETDPPSYRSQPAPSSSSWVGIDPSVRPNDAHMYPCDDPLYACVCIDCYQKCPLPEDWVAWYPAPCLVLGGHLTCWNAAMILLYTLFVSVLMGILAFRLFFRPRRRIVGEEQGIVPPDDNGLLQKAPPSPSTKLSRSHAQEEASSSSAPSSVPYKYSLDRAISSYFYKHGLWIADNVKLVIVVLFLLIILAIISQIFTGGVQVEMDPVKLWVGPMSESAIQKAYYDRHFGPFYRVSQVIISKPDGSEDRHPMVTFEGITLVYDLLDRIKNISVALDGGTGRTGERPDNARTTLDDICYKPLGRECLIQSVAMLWPSKDDFENSASWMDDFNKCMRSPADCLNMLPDGPLRVPVIPELVIGGIALNYTQPRPGAGGRPSPLPVNPDVMLDETKSLVITVLLMNDLDHQKIAPAVAWERAFIDMIRQAEQENPSFSFSYSTESSIEDEINRDAQANAPIVIASYVAMFAYVAVALGRYDRANKSSWRSLAIHARASLALGGVFIVAVSILFSATVFSLVGVKTTLIIAEVIPFLVLAVGVDNLFLLIQAYDGTAESLPIPIRVAQTFSRSGPSILVTELAELLAFGAGSLVDMPAVSSFSMYAALAIFFDILMQMTVFAAFLTLDGYRRAKNNPDPIFRFIDLISYGKLLKTAAVSRQQGDGADEFTSTPGPGLLSVWMRKWVAPPLTKRKSIQMLVLVLYSFLVFLSFIGIGHVRLGLEQRLAVPSDSYLIKYFDAIEEDLLVGPPVFFVLHSGNMEDINVQRIVASRYYQDIFNDKSIGSIIEVNRGEPGAYLASPISNWLDDFLAWGRVCCLWKPGTRQRCPRSIPGCVPCIPPGVHRLEDLDWNKTLGMGVLLEMFLAEMPTLSCPLAGGAAYSSQVILRGGPKTGGGGESALPGSTDGAIVLASAFRAYMQPLRSQEDFIESLRSARRIASLLGKSKDAKTTEPLYPSRGLHETSSSSDLGDSGSFASFFAYSPYFIFFDQYLAIIPVSMVMAAILLVAIFVVAWILLGCGTAAIFTAVSVGSVAICLVGGMGWWGITLSAVSLVNVIIAMGISVEFCANMMRAYMVTPGTRQQRVSRCIEDTGAPIFTGITVTKLIGILVLYFSNSKIFQVFYFRMYFMTVILAAIHGLIVLPVALTLFGPLHFIYNPNGSGDGSKGDINIQITKHNAADTDK